MFINNSIILFLLSGALAVPTASIHPPNVDARDIQAHNFIDAAGKNVTVYLNGRGLHSAEDQPRVMKRMQRIDSNKNEDYCGGSTFVQKSSDASPRTDDCRTLADFVGGIKTYWVFDRNDQWNTPLAWSGECTFGVHTNNVIGTAVGNTDVADLVRDSCNKFGGARVGAEGHVGCTLAGISAGVDWAVYHR
jgi:hypothetical protein